MCGIVGFVGFRGVSREGASATVQAMALRIAHRGPDEAGVWVGDSLEVALGHRRLSIVDLSPAGSQPMTSGTGRFVIVFNGEIYNQDEMRRELATEPGFAPKWRGHSDTETLLECLAIWGVEKTLRAAIGMFAFALVDRQERCLYLARDRAGEKPLYYGWQRGVFMFTSELKALKSHPRFEGEIDRSAITLQLRHSYIPAPYSIYKGISKLAPGSFLRLPLSPLSSQSSHFTEIRGQTARYWSFAQVALAGQQNPFRGDDQEAIQTLDGLLRDAVRRQMMADVPLGAFLSGGIDSSTIVALMQAQSTRPVRTFTIGFNEPGYNEAEHAKAVAQHLGTEHVELYVSPEEARSVIPRLPHLYDEPFSDSSQIPTYLISQLTRRHVTVSLSGDAGDELFCGYPRYAFLSKVWRRSSYLPAVARRGMGLALQLVGTATWDSLVARFASLLPTRLRTASRGIQSLGRAILLNSPEVLYRSMVSHWAPATDVVMDSHEPDTALSDRDSWSDLPDVEHRMMFLDFLSYLPGDILCKVDRAAMAVSLETRIPMLDHRIIEFVWSLPFRMKVRDGQSKWILRQVLEKYVPRALTERPKMGFGVPLDAWLRGPLRAWCEDLLDENRIRRDGYLNPAPIRKLWGEFLSDGRDWKYYLWDVLMLQSWLAEERVT